MRNCRKPANCSNCACRSSSQISEDPDDGCMELWCQNLRRWVVKMRKDVKKVKVLIIRKLTRHIAKLKSKKGTEELTLKNQRRAQRLLEEIHSVKELKPDDVTKTALRKEISFEKVFKKPSSTTEERAIARLATHPLLKQKITAIKEAVKAFKEARKTASEGEKEKEKDEPMQVTKIKETKKPVQAKQNKNAIKKEIPAPKQHVKEVRCKNLQEDSDKSNENACEPPHVQENMPADTPPIAENKEQPKAQEVESPEVESPVVESPVVESPVVESPVVESPVVESPVVESPVVESPEVDCPDIECPEMESPPQKKACLEQVLSSDSSDIEDSEQEKEYFDDSTEERFYKHSSSFEDSDGDSDNDFFIGKVRRTKKKKSNKDGIKQKEEKAPPTKDVAQTSEVQKEIPTSKSMKLQSVFCKSLSHTRPKPSFTKRERNFPQERSKKTVAPQANPLAKKPFQSKVTSVKQQGKKSELQPLHPSWEASRKRKEQQAQITTFQGKKIIFDD
ncbi:serum response factor binding protein 1 L homeolog isoform X2 [Xenopus laevis]|uniref:Serum response factor-binding protein 1 n=1 Tax=Xenopus laevis TaxID=8355 RepID=A0A8J1KU77_XENLA|nr:serum response factor binding protein 1 L homeolog isoform X2 [Xenopus laevis]